MCNFEYPRNDKKIPLILLFFLSHLPHRYRIIIHATHLYIETLFLFYLEGLRSVKKQDNKTSGLKDLEFIKYVLFV